MSAAPSASPAAPAAAEQQPPSRQERAALGNQLGDRLLVLFVCPGQRVVLLQLFGGEEPLAEDDEGRRDQREREPERQAEQLRAVREGSSA